MDLKLTTCGDGPWNNVQLHEVKINKQSVVFHRPAIHGGTIQICHVRHGYFTVRNSKEIPHVKFNTYTEAYRAVQRRIYKDSLKAQETADSNVQTPYDRWIN